MGSSLLLVTSLAVTAATSALATPTAPKTPFFSVIREGPQSQKAIGIHNPLSEDIALTRLAIGRKFSASKEEIIIQLYDQNIRGSLYDTAPVPSDAVRSNGGEFFCAGKSFADDTVDQESRDWWGDYDACQWIYQALTDFNQDDVLKLYLDGEVVDVFGDEADLHTNNVCGVTSATKGGTLVRKQSVERGNTTPLGSFGTNPENCEWAVFKPDSLIGMYYSTREN